MVDEQFGYPDFAANRQPGPDILGGLLPQWQGPLPTTLALDLNGWRRLKAERGQRQPDQL